MYHTFVVTQGSSNSAESRVLATFLTEMDGVGSLRGDGVIVVGATNRPEVIDKALLRPGRFDQVVYAALPGMDARRQVILEQIRLMVLRNQLSGAVFYTKSSIYICSSPVSDLGGAYQKGGIG